MQILATDLDNLIKTTTNLVIIDVRDAEEYNKYHISNAININIGSISLDTLVSVLKLNANSNLTLVTCCNTGGRGGRAYETIKTLLANYTNINVLNLQHGINSFIKLKI